HNHISLSHSHSHSTSSNTHLRGFFNIPVPIDNNNNSNNNNNNSINRKNIIEETIFNNNSQKTSDYERVINDMVNPNPNNIVRNNRNNNIENIKRDTPASPITNTINRNDKEEIMKKAVSDVANYKRQKANNRINRDFNNIKTKSKDEGIYLVEYNENTGDITLIFRNREFNNNVSIERAIKTLLNGATDDENNKNIISCIPRNTELLDIFVEDDIVYLNFNEDFEFNPLGNEGTMIQIYQLVYTATQFEGIDKVIFLINGNLNETIGAEGSIENTAFMRF
ncbi:GerMN domain-containing protein, partial [Brachyspira sp.]|uniref:GerMN domain-containing protein n=1 Tax=Brachyspira sp. TaxID=1977261 RepID=UPI003D7CDFBF